MLSLICFVVASSSALTWFHEARPTAQAWAIVELLQHADDEGLRVSDYEGDSWVARLLAVDADPSRLDAALSLAFSRYVSDIGAGRINPRRVHADLDVTALRAAATAAEARIRAGADPGLELAALRPRFRLFGRTLLALERYRGMARHGTNERLPPLRVPLAPNDTYDGTAQLDARLRAEGDLTVARQDVGIYDATLAEAIKRFQARHQLAPSGLIDAATFKTLDTPLAQRVLQLELTLERLRWLPRTVASPIIINVPEFRLHAFDDDGQRVFSTNVVVGQAYGHQTPVFMGQLKEIVFRPEWNVPLAIQRDELVPQIDEHRDRFATTDFEIVDRAGQVVERTLDDALIADLRAARLRLRQKPGPGNALGLIKFVFPNSHDVYLHDTPFPQLFAKSRRDFSHGCIRVEDPVQLAAWVLKSTPTWSADAIDSAMHATHSSRVSLEQPVPVLILYSTAIVAATGEVRFFDDIYKLDEALERALREHSRALSKGRGAIALTP